MIIWLQKEHNPLTILCPKPLCYQGGTWSVRDKEIVRQGGRDRKARPWVRLSLHTLSDWPPY